MAELKKSGRARRVPSPTMAGRSPSCGLLLESPHSSAEHALLRWDGSCWQLADLGSRNGTWVRGRQLASGDLCELHTGDTISFGCPEETWIVTDASAPRPFARCEEREVVGDHSSLSLPDDHSPLASIYYHAQQWCLYEGADNSRIVDNKEVIEIQGRRWRLFLPPRLPRTDGLSVPFALCDMTVELEHSAHEEHIEVWLRNSDGRTINLGTRAHHVVLLELARERVRDDLAARPVGEQGWIHRDELAERAGISVNHLNIMIHRIRRQLAKLGHLDAPTIVEGRPRLGEIRLGPKRVKIFTTASRPRLESTNPRSP